MQGKHKEAAKVKATFKKWLKRQEQVNSKPALVPVVQGKKHTAGERMKVALFKQADLERCYKEFNGETGTK